MPGVGEMAPLPLACVLLLSCVFWRDFDRLKNPFAFGADATRLRNRVAVEPILDGVFGDTVATLMPVITTGLVLVLSTGASG